VRLRKNYGKQLLAPSCMSDCPRATASLALDGLSLFLFFRRLFYCEFSVETRMMNETSCGKNLDGRDTDVMEVLTAHVPGVTVQFHENPK
jgi:hypothetical protein